MRSASGAGGGRSRRPWPAPWAGLVLLALVAMAGCTTPAPGQEFEIEVLGAESAAQIDSMPEPVLAVVAGRLQVTGFIGLGATGYELVPSGSTGGGVVELLVTPRMPEEMAGLTVLTRYAYRLTTPTLPPGAYTVRLRYADPGGGAPRLVLEGRIRVD